MESVLSEDEKFLIGELLVGTEISLIAGVSERPKEEIVGIIKSGLKKLLKRIKNEQ